MSIRNDKYEWTREADEFSRVVRNALQPIFDEYENRLSFEDMYYLVSTEFQEIILTEVISRRGML